MNKKSLIQGDIVSVNGKPCIFYYWVNDGHSYSYSIIDRIHLLGGKHGTKLLPINVSLLVFLDFEPVLKGEGWTKGEVHVKKSRHGWTVRQGTLPEQNIKYVNELQRYL